MGQQFHHFSDFQKNLSCLTARLNDLAHSFCDSPIDVTDFTTRRKCFDADHIIITKADYCSQVLILNKSDYINKINSILNNSSEFEKLGSVEEKDNITTIEKRIQRKLFELMNGNIIQQDVYNGNRPSCSQTPRFNWLTKIYKTNIPLFFCVWFMSI